MNGNSNLKEILNINPLSPEAKKMTNNGTVSAAAGDIEYFISKLPDPEELLKDLNQEIKVLKGEAKDLFGKMEEGKKDLEKAVEEAKEISRQEQRKKLIGNELIKLDHLKSLGFEADVIQEHLMEENSKLEKEWKAKQKDRKNVEININKMATMNQECDKAVQAAEQAYIQLVATNQKLQAMLSNAEVNLYAMETKVMHKRNIKGVEITSNDALKKTLLDVIKEVRDNSKDDDLVRDVMKIAGKCLSLESSRRFDDDGSDNSSSSSSVSLSSCSSSSSDS